MKVKKSDVIAKIFITAVIVILVGLLIAWMTGVFKEKKQDLNSGTEKIDQTLMSVADFDLLVYDGNSVSGETLTELIKEFKAKDVNVAIWVRTLDGTDAYYNYAFTSSTATLGASNTTTPPTSKTASGYITPSQNFLGAIIRNTNNEIVCIKFVQQK